METKQIGSWSKLEWVLNALLVTAALLILTNVVWGSGYARHHHGMDGGRETDRDGTGEDMAGQGRHGPGVGRFVPDGER